MRKVLQTKQAVEFGKPITLYRFINEHAPGDRRRANWMGSERVAEISWQRRHTEGIYKGEPGWDGLPVFLTHTHAYCRECYGDFDGSHWHFADGQADEYEQACERCRHVTRYRLTGRE
jgi:hypothetical protein